MDWLERVDFFMILKAFRDNTGKTQGMIFKIRPPKKAANRSQRSDSGVGTCSRSNRSGFGLGSALIR